MLEFQSLCKKRLHLVVIGRKVSMSDQLFTIFILLMFFISVFAQNNVPQRDKCGTLNTEYFYNPKNLTDIDEFPWMVSVQNTSLNSCFGTLISKWFVLVSARCVSEVKDTDSVVLGDWNWRNSRKKSDCDDRGRCTPVPKLHKIEEIIIHPNYSWSNEDSFEDPIALVKLSEPVTYSDFISPICLPSKDIVRINFDNQLLEVTGWFFNNSVNPNKAKSFARVVTYNTCELWLKKYYKVDKEKIICALSCVGRNIYNVGSALMGMTEVDEEPANYYLIGLSVLRQAECPSRNPDVYVRIDRYLDWIYANIEK